MARLDDLQLTLDRGNRGKADLAGLDERYATAKALRDSAMPEVNAQSSYLAPLVNVLKRNRGRKELREIAPQRQQARADIASSASALPMYNAKVANDAVNLAAANRTEDQGLAKAIREEKRKKEQAALDLAETNRLYEQGAFSDITPMWTADGVEVQVGLDDRKLPVDTNTGQRMDISQLLSADPALTASTIAKNNGAGTSGRKPGATAQALYLKQKQLKDDLQSSTAAYEALDEVGLAELNQPIKQGLKSYFVPDEAQRMMENKMYTSAEAKDYMSGLARLESTFSEMISGKAVSGFEMKDRQKWSINAPGIDDAERQRRVKRMLAEVKNQTAKYEEYYPGYALDEAQDTASDDGFDGWGITEVTE